MVDTRTGRIRDMWPLSPADYNARVYPDNTEGTLQNLRAYALFKSSDKHNCDLIVAPTFDIKISDDGAVINVTGYPANFANWATGSKADYDSYYYYETGFRACIFGGAQIGYKHPLNQKMTFDVGLSANYGYAICTDPPSEFILQLERDCG